MVDTGNEDQRTLEKDLDLEIGRRIAEFAPLTSGDSDVEDTVKHAVGNRRGRQLRQQHLHIREPVLDPLGSPPARKPMTAVLIPATRRTLERPLAAPSA